MIVSERPRVQGIGIRNESVRCRVEKRMEASEGVQGGQGERDHPVLHRNLVGSHLLAVQSRQRRPRTYKHSDHRQVRLLSVAGFEVKPFPVSRFRCQGFAGRGLSGFRLRGVGFGVSGQVWG